MQILTTIFARRSSVHSLRQIESDFLFVKKKEMIKSFNVRSVLKFLIIGVGLISVQSNVVSLTSMDEISELDNTSSTVVLHEKHEKLPLYVKELYEIVKSENGPTKRNQIDYFDDAAPLTIQAIRQERNDASSTDDYVDMKFSLKKLWVSPFNMARAELVLGVRKNLIRPSSSSYVVNVYTSSSNDVNGRRRLVSQVLDVSNEMDSDFLIVPFTDIIKSLITDWHQTKNRTEILTVRLNVDETRRGDDDDVYQMEASKVRHLFRATNHGHYSPLLILYSSEIDSKSYSFFDRRRKRRLRRDTDDDADEPASPSYSGSSSDVGVIDENCSLRSWIVDLKQYFSHEIITPRVAKINFCSGKCPFPAFDSHWNSTANAVIRKNFVTTGVNDGGGFVPPIYVPDAVCVPKSYSSLTTLSLKENGLYLIENKMNMIVTSCMCA